MSATAGLEVKRRIRGNLHGSIDVSPLEDAVISHPLMQRLRRIKQTSFLSYVFPGATHTRFEHSLGVLHLAGVTWDKIRHNQSRLRSNIRKYPRYHERESSSSSPHGLILPTLDLADEIFGSAYVLQCLRLAALLHDIGHPPFSHSGERFLVTVAEFIAANPEMPQFIRDFLDAAREPAGMRANHETYTLLLANKVLEDVQAKNASSFPFLVKPRDVLCIIKPRIGPEPGSPLAKYALFRLCHELVSGELDVDRMDYLQRDSRESGVIYGIFDASRILDSLMIYLDPKDDSLHLAIQLSGLAAFEDYLRARQSMYLQLYFHKTSVAAEAMLKALARDLGDYRLPASAADYAAIDEYNIYGKFEGALGAATCKDPEAARRNLDNLLLNRDLWKRVYEVSGQKNDSELEKTAEDASRILDALGVRYEKVSSSVDLTRFSPRAVDGSSRNYLRLVKKDSGQFPRVLPIEDECSFINRAESLKIIRIYVDSTSSQELLAKVKTALAEL